MKTTNHTRAAAKRKVERKPASRDDHIEIGTRLRGSRRT
jgi:hypothetical protein